MVSEEESRDNPKLEEDVEEIELSGQNDLAELAKIGLIAFCFALVIRTFAFEPFNIPSGSMIPTLQIGDYLFVSKYSYGYSRYSFPFGLAGFDGRVLMEKPERGDVAVFKLPHHESVDYIKRLVGLPGDKIQVREGILHINGEAVPRERIGTREQEGPDGRPQLYTEYIETLPNGVRHRILELSDHEELDNTDVFEVPEGYYFAMGDNRDSSMDSRVTGRVGLIPVENLVGRAEKIFFSIEPDYSFLAFWNWPTSLRFDRFLKDIG